MANVLDLVYDEINATVSESLNPLKIYIYLKFTY